MMFEIDPVATFTGPEMAKAIGMPFSTFELLIREGLIMGRVTSGGRGKQAHYNFSGLSHIVMTGVLNRVVEGHVMAARIAEAISGNLSEDGRPCIPFGFEDLQHKLHSMGRSMNARGPDDEFCRYRTIEAAWRNGLVDETKAMPADYILVIVDGHLVGQTAWNGIRILLQNNKRNDGSVEPLMSYQYFGKSKGVEVRNWRSEAEEDVFYDRLRNAESVVQLNLALALRRAVVAIIEMREGAE